MITGLAHVRSIGMPAMALPEPPEELCFSTDALIDKEFNVDEFVSTIRKRVTIECLREDLDTYFRTLKNAMVELINKDYADFVALSANLVSVTINSFLFLELNFG